MSTEEGVRGEAGEELARDPMVGQDHALGNCFMNLQWLGWEGGRVREG